ncbi:MAG: hypothetical protein AAF661_07915 [Pseudomonadota bacterium]
MRAIIAIFAIMIAALTGQAAAQGTGLDPLALQPQLSECGLEHEDPQLRENLRASSRLAMRVAMENIDFNRAVDDAWTSVGFEQRYERIIDDQIEVLRADTNYLDRLKQANLPGPAEEMATKTVDAVFSSTEFSVLQDDLQDEIGRRLEPDIRTAGLSAQNSSAECVRRFLSARYPGVVGDAFERQETLAVSFDSIATSGAGATINMAVIISGIIAVIFRRVIARIARAIARRLGVALAARVAAMISAVGGLVLLGYELIAGNEGVFPVVKDEMVSEETLRGMRGDLKRDLASAAPEEMNAVADQIAADLFEKWRRFKTDYAFVLDLRDRNPAFARFLAGRQPDEFFTLATLVGRLRADGGEAAVLDAFETGVLEKAIGIPRIEEHLDAWAPRGLDLRTLVDWHDRSAGDFEQVLTFELPTAAQPTDFSREELGRLLSIGERKGVLTVAGLPASDRNEAFALSDERLRRLAVRLDGPRMAAVFATTRALPDAGTRLLYLDRAAERPDLARGLVGAAPAVANSRSPEAALAMLMDPQPLYNVLAVYDHAQIVLDGEVAPQIPVYRYGWWLAVFLGAPLLIVFWILRGIIRTFRPAPRQTVRVEVAPAALPREEPRGPSRGGPV